MRLLRAPVAVLGLLAVALSACTSAAPTTVARTQSATIRFASYDFQENQILAEVYAAAARRHGLPVSVQHGIGTREVVSPALQQGVVDVVVDYLGTALTFARPDFHDLPASPEEMHAVLSRVMGGRGVLVLDASRAEDQNGFAVTADFAAKHGLTRLSQLAPLAGDLTFGGPPECPTRPFCLSGLRTVYGLRFGKVVSMPSRAATVEALISGQIDIGLLETTDARLSVAPVVLLGDDRSLQPAENVVPFVRFDAVQRWGTTLRTALNEVSARLTTADLVRMNRWVEVDGLTPAKAAAKWWAAD
jgi:osmoprotectant transport system substrate-binding protein